MKVACKHSKAEKVICIGCHRKALEKIAMDLLKTSRQLSGERLNRSFLTLAVQHQHRKLTVLQKKTA